MTRHYTVGSSHGSFTIDGRGRVVICRADNNDADGGAHLASITRFDLREWRRYWKKPLITGFDILDLGYWYADSKTNKTSFAPSDAKWRSEIGKILLERRISAVTKRAVL